MDSAGFEILPAPPELRPFVRRYMYANRALEEPLTLHPKPTGYCYFSNSFGWSPHDRITVNGVSSERESRWYLAGKILDHEIEVRHERSLRVIYAELAATAEYRLFAIPGKSITGVALPLGAAGERFADLARGCFVAGTDATREEHVAESNRFFAALVNDAQREDPQVMAAVEMLESANGAARVGDIAAALGANVRTLNRRFTHIVGVSPKLFGQILQINWVVGSLYAGDKTKIAGIAQEAGFSDQAHLNRAMQHFFNQGPRAFLQSDYVAFATFLGASRDVQPTEE